MRIALGSDHRGRMVKNRIRQWLVDRRHDVVDVGPDQGDSIDYPDVAREASLAVVRGEAEQAILICGTGLGMSIAANKINGIRAAAVHDEVTAELGRAYNDANVLCLPADLLGESMVNHILEIWFHTEFEGGRHARRIEKIRALEGLDSPREG